MSDETKPGETAEIDSNTSKADLKAAADDILKSAPKQEDAPEAQVDVDPVQRLEIEKEELREQLLRTLADLDNTRKRAERQVSDARVYAIEKFAGDLLSVADNLERGLAALDADDDALQGAREGIELTLKSLLDAFAKYNLEQISPSDEPFNPELHEAMTMVPVPNVEPNTVIDVLEKGYQLNGRLIRPARVVVSKAAE